MNDVFFHITQGMLLIEKKDAESIKKALNHFRESNLMTQSGDIAKPQALYSLAYGNLIIGNIERAYVLVNKAFKELDVSKKQSMLKMDVWPGEDKITELLSLLNESYPNLQRFSNIKNEGFDENYLDFSNIPLLFESDNTVAYETYLKVDSISNDVLTMVFTAMLRYEEDLIYFDKIRGEPLAYVEGYFVSSSGDQTLNNRMLANKIMNNSPSDLVDEDRHILIPRLICSDFIDEFRTITSDEKTYYEFADTFTKEIIKSYKDSEVKTLKDLYLTNHTLDFFFNCFKEKFAKGDMVMMRDFDNMMAITSNTVAKRWIQNIV